MAESNYVIVAKEPDDADSLSLQGAFLANDTNANDDGIGGSWTRHVVSASPTVVADSLAEADLWATVAVVGGDDLSWVSAALSRSGMTVTDDGGVRRWLGTTEVAVVTREHSAA